MSRVAVGGHEGAHGLDDVECVAEPVRASGPWRVIAETVAGAPAQAVSELGSTAVWRRRPRWSRRARLEGACGSVSVWRVEHFGRNDESAPDAAWTIERGYSTARSFYKVGVLVVALGSSGFGPEGASVPKRRLLAELAVSVAETDDVHGLARFVPDGHPRNVAWIRAGARASCNDRQQQECHRGGHDGESTHHVESITCLQPSLRKITRPRYAGLGTRFEQTDGIPRKWSVKVARA